MKKNKQALPLLKNVEITDAASEGVAVARVEGKVLFVKNAVPGDIADVQVVKKRSSYLEGIPLVFHHYSDKREEPVCSHFGLCGGCKWQNMKYEYQLFYKQKQVADNLERIGEVDVSNILPIVSAKETSFYRNKLEYTFSDKRWLTKEDMYDNAIDRDLNALGFHIPGFFDKVLDIDTCYLQSEPSNSIRLEVKKYCTENHLQFFNIKNQTGLLRNLIIRCTSTGEWMLILSFYKREDSIFNLLKHIAEKFPELTSVMFVINGKKNDTITDLKIENYKGCSFITEIMEELKFKISPVSFFQTNYDAAYKLYKIVRTMADLNGNELVYDLYTGTGTIANFIAKSAKKVIGIEYIESAVMDAKENSELNNIHNTSFFAGDLAKVFQSEFIQVHGNPDVIITDPPRAGMHTDVLKQIKYSGASRVVYVSCNSATQARDIKLLSEVYQVSEIQPVDMFPHTHHVESVVLLKKK